MLQSIRDKTQGLVTWIIVSIICVTFAFWGISSYFMSDTPSNEVATVNGETITTDNLNRRYQQLLQQHQSPEQREISLQDQQMLREIALQQLIQQAVLVQAALQQGFLITDKEIVDLLVQIPELQQHEKFSSERLQKMLHAIGMTKAEFFQHLRQQLLIAQIQETILGSSFVLPNEVVDYIKQFYQTRDLAYAVIPCKAFEQRASDAFDEKAINDYYQAHQDSFLQPEKLVLDYVIVEPNDPEFVKKSDQLANLSYEYPDSLKVVAEILNVTIQTTPAITSNGDLSNPVTSSPDVLRIAFSDELIRDKYNSEVISLDSGALVVVRVNRHQPAKPKPLAEVKADIIDTLRQQAAKKQAYLAGQAFMKDLTGGKSLQALAAQYHAKFFQKQFVSRDTDTVNPEIITALFRLPIRSFPQRTLIQLENGHVVIVELRGLHQVDQRKVDGVRSEVVPFLSDSFGQAELLMYRHAVNDHAKVKRHGSLKQTMDD